MDVEQLQSERQIILQFIFYSKIYFEKFKDFISKIQDSNPLKKFALEFIKHIRNLMENGILDNEQIKKLFLYFTFEPVVPKTGENKEPLLTDNFVYRVLPECIKVNWTDFEYIKNQDVDATCSFQLIDQPNAQITSQDEKLFRSFQNMFKYFLKIPFPYISEKQISNSIKYCKEQFYGIDDFLDKFQIQINQFRTVIFQMPKGVLLYGPPGTGKSAISKAFCEQADMLFVYPPMAAGDFSRGIVGESELMINSIAARARVIPWELCVLLIDEIDYLAPNRKDSKSAKNDSLLGVFLAILDGTKTTPNLKIFASTNLKENMDESFLNRIEVQMFVGNPSPTSREKWIQKKLELCVNQTNYLELKNFLSNQEVVNSLRNKTINFSSDALRKLLERFYQKIINGEHKEEKKSLENILNECLLFISKEMNIYLGKSIVANILQNNLVNLMQILNQANKQGQTVQPNFFQKRIYLIDLQIKEPKEQFQILCEKVISPEMKQKIAKLEEIYKQIKNSNPIDDQKDFLIYQQIVQLFPKNNHFFDDEGLVYNQYRHLIKNNQLSYLEYIKKIYNYNLDGIKEQQFRKMINHFRESILKEYKREQKILTYQIEKDYFKLLEIWLPLIVNFALKIDAHCIKLIDDNFFALNFVSSDIDAYKLINNTVEMMKKYETSVIIFDLDTISGIDQNYSGFTEELQSAGKAILLNKSYYFTKSRPKALELALNIGKDLQKTDNLWVFYVGKSKKILQECKQKLRFPQLQSEQSYQENEELLDRQQICEKCFQSFTQRENNKQYLCYQHQIDRLYNIEDVQNKMKQNQNITEDFAIKLVRSYTTAEVFSLIEKGNINYTQFVYKCCKQTVYDPGEIPRKHIEQNKIQIPKNH